LFVLHTGIAWQHLPAELGFGSGVTRWRRQTEHGSGLVHQVDVAWTLQ
jgi:transposase